MQRKNAYVGGLLGLGAVVLVGYFIGLARAQEHLARLTPQAILHKASLAVRDTPFAQTLRYRQTLVPTELNVSRLINLPVPDSNVTSLTLYEASPWKWRLEELDAQGIVVGVVARQREKLITYQALDNQRTIMDPIPTGAKTAWTLWLWPNPVVAERDWTLHAQPGRLDGRPAYELMFRPKVAGTLMSTVRYWFSGRNFLPLGFSVSARDGQVVLSAETTSLSIGPVGGAADAPTVGRAVAWHVSPLLAHEVVDAGQMTAAQSSLRFPSQFGPLPLVNQRRSAGASVAVYGRGPGQVVVLATNARAFKRDLGSSFFRPLAGYPQLKGITDGVLSLVTLKVGSREMTVMASRPQRTLARWANAAWR